MRQAALIPFLACLWSASSGASYITDDETRRADEFCHAGLYARAEPPLYLKAQNDETVILRAGAALEDGGIGIPPRPVV